MAEITYAKKRLEPIIKKYSIDVENDKVFKSIITLFNGQTDYQIWALKLVFGHFATLDNVIHFKEWADANPNEIQHLSLHNLISYKNKANIAALNKEIAAIDNLRVVKDVVSRFNTAQRRVLHEVYIEPFSAEPWKCNGNSAFRSFAELAKQFLMLPAHRQQKFISLMSAVSSASNIISHLKNAIEETYEWNREDMLLYAQRCCPDVEVCYDNNNVVVLRIPSFASSAKLCGSGRTSWCLTCDESYFNRYTYNNDNAQQFFLFDFNKRENHELAHVGFSVSPLKGINFAHSTRNNSLMGEVSVDGEGWNIQKVLKHHNIDKSVYVRLKQLVNYKWDKTDFLQFAERNSIKVLPIEDGRVIVFLDDRTQAESVLAHTLCPTRTPFEQNMKMFAVMDFSLEKDNENAVLAILFSKDRYDTLSFHSLFNAYGERNDKKNALAEHKMKSDMFVSTEGINPNVLLHKLIDECNYEAAIKLLKENKSVDPNHVFCASLPAVKAITSGNVELFNALAAHPKFDFRATEGFGNPYVNFLILYIEGVMADGDKNIAPWVSMIRTLINNPQYDCMQKDINEDTALHAACEDKAFISIVRDLLAHTEIDVNARNCWDNTPLAVALDAVDGPNMEAVKLLLLDSRTVIDKESVKIAKQKKIDLEALRHSLVEQEAEAEEKDETINDDFSEVFSRIFKG